MPEAYLDLEEKLRPLADPLPPPRPGDWLAGHDEPGQTFDEYLDARPVRKSDKLHTICWNLRVEPVPYWMKLNTFCQQKGFGAESVWYERAKAALAT